MELGAAFQGKNLKAQRSYGDVIEPTRWNLAQAIIDRDICLAKRLLEKDPFIESNKNNFHEVFEDSGDHSPVKLKPNMRPAGFINRTNESPLELAIIRGELEIVKKICQNRDKEELTKNEALAVYELFRYLIHGDSCFYGKTYTKPKNKNISEIFLFLIVDQPKVIEILNKQKFTSKDGSLFHWLLIMASRTSSEKNLTKLVEALHVVLVNQFPGKSRKELEDMKTELIKNAEPYLDIAQQTRFSNILNSVISI